MFLTIECVLLLQNVFLTIEYVLLEEHADKTHDNTLFGFIDELCYLLMNAHAVTLPTARFCLCIREEGESTRAHACARERERE